MRPSSPPTDAGRDDAVTPEVHARVTAAFAEAMTLPVDERQAVVEAIRGECAVAGRELDRWIAAARFLGDGSGPGFLSTPMVRLESLLASDDSPTEGASGPALPAQIGEFSILREVGRGAFARVFLASQRSPSRPVAIKLLARGLDGRDILARFDRERHILARLQHPSIASLHEVGLFDGAPYFVMEWVDGSPLVAFAESRSLPLAPRLRLFMQLCRAVQHAHERGVIHRDLKPSNILAYESQGECAVKVIDFGVAKALQCDAETPLGDLSVHTLTGMLVGTPPYMSPELLDGNAVLADTRCDIYALGAILFELLTGRRLLGDQRSTLNDYRRLARERAIIGLPRGLLGMSRSLQRDLEAIIELAASPDPERRYRSAGDLCDDIESAMAGRPTRARPLPWFEAVRRVARAHPLAAGVAIGAVIGVASLVLALSARLESAQLRSQLITSTVASMWSAEQLRGKLGVEQERAELQRSSLASARRLAPLADDRETLRILARALQGAHEAEIEDADRSEEAARESHLRSAESIGVEHLAVRRSIASRTDATLEDRAAVAVALVLVGNGQERLARYDLAESLYRQALAAEEAMLATNPDHPLVLMRICYSFERLSVLARRRGDLDGEREFVRRRLEVALRLAAGRPSEADSQLNLAEARRFALTIDDLSGSVAPPLPHGDSLCDAHITHTRELARSRPVCMRSQREYAIALAIGARRMPRADQASSRVTLLTEASEVLRGALRRQPDDPDLMDPLASVISDLAQEAEWSGETLSALAQLEEQHDLIQRLIACRPYEALYRKAASICERRIKTLASAR